MSKIPIHSIFEEISLVVFQMKDLEQARTYTIQFVNTKKINETDKQSILREVTNMKTISLFHRYICNALLKYEGLGMNQIRKSSRESAADDALKFD